MHLRRYKILHFHSQLRDCLSVRLCTCIKYNLFAAVGRQRPEGEECSIRYTKRNKTLTWAQRWARTYVSCIYKVYIPP